MISALDGESPEGAAFVSESFLVPFTTRHLNADDADSPQIDADSTGFVSLRAGNPRKSVFFCVNLRPRKSVSGNELFRLGWVDVISRVLATLKSSGHAVESVVEDPLEAELAIERISLFPGG